MLKTMGMLALSTAAAMTAVPAQAALVVNAGTIGQRLIVTSTANVVARYEGATALFSSDLFLDGRAGAIFNNGTANVGDLVDLGSFAVGTELLFRLDTPTQGSFFTGPASRNPDGLAHAAANFDGSRTFAGFEDLTGGGDLDYDDLVFSFTSVGVSGAVPEPATWAMMLIGFGGIGGAMRRYGRTTTRVRFA